jgi:hypothetical protein
MLLSSARKRPAWGMYLLIGALASLLLLATPTRTQAEPGSFARETTKGFQHANLCSIISKSDVDALFRAPYKSRVERCSWFSTDHIWEWSVIDSIGGLDIHVACPRGCGDVNWVAWSHGKGAVGYEQAIGQKMKVGPYPSSWDFSGQTLSVAVTRNIGVEFRPAWAATRRPPRAVVKFALKWAPRIARADWH